MVFNMVGKGFLYRVLVNNSLAMTLLFKNIKFLLLYHYSEPEWRGKESVFHTVPQSDLSCFRVDCKSAIIITYKAIMINYNDLQ